MLNFFNKNQFYCCFTYKLVQKGILSIDEVIQRFIRLRKSDENEEQVSSNNTWGQKSYGSKWGTKSNQISIDISKLVNILNWFYPELLEYNLIDKDLKLAYRNNFLLNEENINIYKKN